MTGEAHVSSDDPPADQFPAYVEKYRDSMALLHMTQEQFAKSFSVPCKLLMELASTEHRNVTVNDLLYLCMAKSEVIVITRHS
jgi:hypothetical protein